MSSSKFSTLHLQGLYFYFVAGKQFLMLLTIPVGSAIKYFKLISTVKYCCSKTGLLPSDTLPGINN